MPAVQTDRVRIYPLLQILDPKCSLGLLMHMLGGKAEVTAKDLVVCIHVFLSEAQLQSMILEMSASVNLM